MSTRKSDWFFIFVFVVCLGMMVVGAAVDAQTGAAPMDKCQVTYTAPTMRVDGRTLTAAEISGYDVRYAIDGNTNYTIFRTTELSPVITDLSSGTYAISVRTVDTENRTSVWTASVLCTVVIPSPSEPGNLRAAQAK